MSDSESYNNSNSDSDDNDSDYEESEDESEEKSKDNLKKFDTKSLVISNKEVNINIINKNMKSCSILQKLRNINMNLDRVGSNINEAVIRYKNNTKSLNNSEMLNSQEIKVPNEFNNYNNPYKKITSYNHNSIKYSNDVRNLYKNQYNDFSSINNKSTFNSSNYNPKFGFNRNNSINGKNNYIDNASNKVYYRRANEMN